MFPRQPLERRADWPTRLEAVLDRARRRAFAFGAADCALLAADCVRAMTGQDPAAAYRGTYRSRREAQRLIARHRSLAVLASLQLGDPDRATNARRGDVVLACLPAPTLGVCLGDRAVFPALRQGLVFLPSTVIEQCWHV